MSQQPNSLQSFFAEMMRRRVFRVMAVYGAVAFVVLQVADIVFPALGLPEWAMTMVLAITMLGFPIAIVLAWAFESTPDGMKRTAPAAPDEIQQIVAAPVKHRWPAGMLALAGIALVFGGGWWMGNRGTGPADILVSEAQASGFKALAVLPFEDVNETEENRLIAVGVHKDLLSQMSRIAALRVTSPTSVREYEDTEKTPQEIAADLGVEYIMEGSVQSSGSQVRVTVTLVDPSTNEQLWNDQYDREVTPDNLFQIQSEVARSVVAALEAELTPQDVETLDAMKPASSLAAQSWYHRGVETYNSAGIAVIPEAIDALNRAVELDPEYTAAWSYLTRVYSRLVFVGGGGREDARRSMERTIELAPGSVEANLAIGYFEYYVQLDFSAALTAFREAERLAPSDTDVLFAVSLILRRQGDWEGSSEMMKQAVRLDPRNTDVLETLVENLQDMGAYREADAILERQLAIEPTNQRARRQKVMSLVHMDGNTDRAWRLAGELGLDPSDPDEGGGLAVLALRDRDYQRALEAIDGIDTRGLAFIEWVVMGMRADALYQMGDPSAAAVADSILDIIDPEAMRDVEAASRRARALLVAGRRDEALAAAHEAAAIVRRWDDHVVIPRFAIGVIATYGRLGEIDAGLDLLEEVLGHPNSEISATVLRLSDNYDAFRGDPRLEELIQVRLDHEAEGQAWAESRRPWLP